MRVTTLSFYRGFQERILRLSEELKKINEKISSGRNINRPSDAPHSLLSSLSLKVSLTQIEQYQRSIERGTSWLNLSESVLSQILQLVERAQELAIQMANDTQSSETRIYTATEVGHLLDQAISLSNTTLGGVYIFSGYKSNTPPFSKTTINGIETAEYNGDTNNFKILIGKGETLIIGKNGKAAISDSGIFDSIGKLKKALETNNKEAILEEIERLREVQDYLNNEISDIEDADYANVVIELRQKEIAYQAALLSSAKIADLTILNYI